MSELTAEGEVLLFDKRTTETFLKASGPDDDLIRAAYLADSLKLKPEGKCKPDVCRHTRYPPVPRQARTCCRAPRAAGRPPVRASRVGSTRWHRPTSRYA